MFSMNKKIIFAVVGILIVLGVFFIFNQSEGSVEEISGVKEFDIIAKQWEFIPSTIEVNQGDKVILNVESIDVNHGIVISSFGINEMLSPRDNVKIEFTANKKGTFPFDCSVSCGRGHYGMVGKIIVN